MQTIGATIRAPIGAAAVAVLALFASLNSYQVAQTAASRSPDNLAIAAAGPRFASAGAMLPASGTIGYISDLPQDQLAGEAAFLGARYAIAPRTLVPADQSKTEWVLGDFARPADFAGLGARAGLLLVRDFGNGVVVYRRPER